MSVESKESIRLVERDYRVLREAGRWRILTGRTLAKIAGFPSQRTGDRRLKKLLVAGYMERQKILYGVPYLYFLTPKGKALIGAPKYKDKIRIDQIRHDLAVANTAIYFRRKRIAIHTKPIPLTKQIRPTEKKRLQPVCNRFFVLDKICAWVWVAVTVCEI